MDSIKDNVIGVGNESRFSLVATVIELADEFDVARDHHPSSVSIKKTAYVTGVLG